MSIVSVGFTVIFFVVMYYYSSTLTWIVLGSIPFYVGLSIFITPVLRERLNEKFKRGAENQAFLTKKWRNSPTIACEPKRTSLVGDG